ncbi:MAG: hypothetical protein JXA43_00910 [Candidatus Diapherotrites archaeon]|nr:hypothetical protein [Candidatus Diapherotrites archaeon]
MIGCNKSIGEIWVFTEDIDLMMLDKEGLIKGIFYDCKDYSKPLLLDMKKDASHTFTKIELNEIGIITNLHVAISEDDLGDLKYLKSIHKHDGYRDINIAHETSTDIFVQKYLQQLKEFSGYNSRFPAIKG